MSIESSLKSLIQGNQSSHYRKLNVSVAGSLDALLSPVDLIEITSLHLTGFINKKDFVTLRKVVHLRTLNLRQCEIQGYRTAKQNEIPKGALSDCDHLERVLLPSTVTTICSLAFYKCYHLKSVHFAKNIVEIQASAFYNCIRLKYVLLPENTEKIGHWAFAGCSGLENIIIKARKVIELDADTHVFFEVDKTKCVIWCPAKDVSFYKNENQWKAFQRFNERNKPESTELINSQTVSAFSLRLQKIFRFIWQK